MSLAEKYQTSGRKGMRGNSLGNHIPHTRILTRFADVPLTKTFNSIAAINFMNRFGVTLAPMEYRARTAKHFSLTAIFRHGRSTEKGAL
ncbi:hypothetical protein CJF32_00005091 [Rutstroemia sp. NJR-2017a WRK4]|nr:hypothetical protein CJF32_00005091 [Rutstroemia sp. NJR-2017a WRK4]